jgi:hypothetical protein
VVHQKENVYAYCCNHFAVSHKSQLHYVDRHLLEVFGVDYEPGAPKLLRKVFIFACKTLYFLSVFMQDAIVGMICGDLAPDQECLIALDIYTNASIRIPLGNFCKPVRYISPYYPLPSPDVYVASLAWTRPVLFLHGARQLRIYRRANGDVHFPPLSLRHQYPVGQQQYSWTFQPFPVRHY